MVLTFFQVKTEILLIPVFVARQGRRDVMDTGGVPRYTGHHYQYRTVRK